MAPDERDRSFDKALARHLHSAAPSGDAANVPADSLSRQVTCPDAETLAAYHERSLLPEEMNSWEAHLVGCAHCQAILAQLELTDEIPLLAMEEEKVLATKEFEPAMAGRKLEELPTSAGPNENQREAAGAALRKKRRASRLYSGVRWRWLAPAGAIAASLLVWIAMHENQPLSSTNSSNTEIAKNQEPAAPTPLPPMQQPSPSSQLHATLSKPQSAADEIASSNARAASGVTRQSQKLDSAARIVSAKPSADKESGVRKDAERDAPEELRREAKQLDQDAKTVAGALQEKVEVQAQAQAQAPNVQSQNQYQYNSPKIPGPGPIGQAESTKKMKTAKPQLAPPPQPAAAAAADVGLMASAEMVMVSDPRLITTTGSTVMWRTGRAGLIEFSANGGASWSRQTSGVIADLLTGSAPSEKVCWIVGRVGAVLLTTDGGAHWKVMTSPVGEDLGGVHATDALHATVWNVRNTKSFETSDGGVTWNRVANP